MFEEGLGRQLDARHDGAAAPLRLRRDGVECGRRAEINDDQRAFVLFDSAHGVYDAVRAHFLRIVTLQLEPGFDARLTMSGSTPKAVLLTSLRAIFNWGTTLEMQQPLIDFGSTCPCCGAAW